MSYLVSLESRAWDKSYVLPFHQGVQFRRAGTRKKRSKAGVTNIKFSAQSHANILQASQNCQSWGRKGDKCIHHLLFSPGLLPYKIITPSHVSGDAQALWGAMPRCQQPLEWKARGCLFDMKQTVCTWAHVSQSEFRQSWSLQQSPSKKKARLIGD